MGPKKRTAPKDIREEVDGNIYSQTEKVYPLYFSKRASIAIQKFRKDSDNSFGIFTDQDIRVGKYDMRLSDVKGEIVSDDDKKAGMGLNDFSIFDTGKTMVVEPNQMATLVNDPFNEKEENCFFHPVPYTKDQRWSLWAKKNQILKTGNELLVGYGERYWRETFSQDLTYDAIFIQTVFRRYECDISHSSPKIQAEWECLIHKE